MAWKRLELVFMVLGLATLATFDPAMSTEIQKAFIFVWTLFIFYSIYLLAQVLRWIESRLSSH